MRAEIGTNVGVNIVEQKNLVTLLEPGELGAMLDIKVWNPLTGKILRQDSRKSESFVQQFLQLLFITMQMPNSGNPQSVRDTGNTLRNVYPAFNTGGNNNGYLMDTYAAATSALNSIVVGTGAVAPTISDYKLGTLIAHGVGGGQLSYGATTYGAPATDGTTSQFTITRNFANSSGGTITPTEIGLYCAWYDQGGSVARYFMIIRDVIAGGIAVPNGQTLTINYRPQATI